MTSHPCTRALAALALSLVLTTHAPASAQATEPTTARLEARVATVRARLAHRADPLVRCELGFLLVRLQRPAEAIEPLDLAITELGAPSSVPARSRLAACTYSRGRAAQALDDLDGARRFYASSLALHDVAETQTRAEAVALSIFFPRDAPVHAPDAAEQAAASALQCADVPQTIDRRASAAGVSWALVACGPGDERALAVAACHASECTAAKLMFDATFGGNGVTRISSVEVHELDGGRDSFLVVRTAEEAGERLDGERVPTIDQLGLYVCELSSGAVSAHHVVLLDRLARWSIDASFEGATATLRRVSGRIPEDLRRALGTAMPLTALPPTTSW